MTNKILFLDIETTKNGKINDVVALFDGQEAHRFFLGIYLFYFA
ncbi:hypothetical protein [Yeosuana sp. AK3]